MTYLDYVPMLAVAYCRQAAVDRFLASFLENTPNNVLLTVADNSPSGLLKFIRHRRITVLPMPHNVGKGAALKAIYARAVCGSRSNHLIVSDSDLELPPSWYQMMHAEANALASIGRFAALAPTLYEENSDSFPSNPRMHVPGPETAVVGPAYYNIKTAGCLMYLSRSFYEECGGCGDDYLYGGDDGKLCKEAVMARSFVGVSANVRIRHLRDGEDDGYVRWKTSNVGTSASRGYWDTI